MREPFVNGQMSIAGGIKLALHIYPGVSKPIVLLHGGPGGYDYMGPVAEMLSPPHLAIGYDQRGGGASTRRGPYHIDTYVKDLEALRAYLDVERFHLFGHSWGGLLAQLYVVDYPLHVASIVLCCSSAGLGWVYREEDRTVNRSILIRYPMVGVFSHTILGMVAGSTQISRMIAPAYFARPGQIAQKDLDIITRFDSGALNATSYSIRRASNSRFNRLQLDPGVPVLRLCGRHDLFNGSERLLRARFPHGQEVWFEESGHFPWIEEPTKFRDVIRAFYQEHAFIE